MPTQPWCHHDWVDQATRERAQGSVGSHAPTVTDALDVARRCEPAADALGTDSWRYLSALATLGATDLTLARVAEPHLDARAVLGQAGNPDLARIGAGPASSFGVYAAQAPGTGLDLTGPDGEQLLNGRKAWCSLAGDVSHALVTAVGPGGEQRLCAIPLTHEGVQHETGAWVARGLAAVTTSTITLHDVPAVPVGPPGFYLDRPGFAWGGIGVAAVWFGGAAAVAGRLLEGLRTREPDQIALMHAGRVDLALHATLLALRDAAARIDAGRAAGTDGRLLAARVRALAAQAAEAVLTVVGHALGPGPLVHEEEHARRVADLTVYVRQQHAERDLAALGALAGAGR